VDFVSTHVYANDTADNVLHTNENVPRDTMVWRAVQMVHDEDCAFSLPEDPAHLLRVQRQLLQRAERDRLDVYGAVGGEQHSSVRWADREHELLAFSDVFEEQGVGAHAVLWGIRTGRRRPHSSPRSTSSASCTSWETGALQSSPTPCSPQRRRTVASPLRCGLTRRRPARERRTPCPATCGAFEDLRPQLQKRRAPMRQPRCGAWMTTRQRVEGVRCHGPSAWRSHAGPGGTASCGGSDGRARTSASDPRQTTTHRPGARTGRGGGCKVGAMDRRALLKVSRAQHSLDRYLRLPLHPPQNPSHPQTRTFSTTWSAAAVYSLRSRPARAPAK